MDLCLLHFGRKYLTFVEPSVFLIGKLYHRLERYFTFNLTAKKKIPKYQKEQNINW